MRENDQIIFANNLHAFKRKLAPRCDSLSMGTIWNALKSGDVLLRVVMVTCSLVALGTSTSLLSQQAPGSPSASLLSQLSTAFSNGQPVQNILLSGTAIWAAGDLLDSGSVSLSISANGSSQMQLVLASSGQKTETLSGMGSSATCQWAGPDGVAHDISQNNCWRPASWFLPAFSFQPQISSPSLGVLDLGLGSIGLDGNVYRRLQSLLLFSDLPPAMAADFAQQSTTTIGLDPSTLLPAVLTYSVMPDNGSANPIAIEVHYSDYRTVSGVQIPFSIQRYVNGSPQLAITVATAQIN